MVRPNDDVITFDCECGFNVFVTYEAKVLGYTTKGINGLTVIKMPKSLIEIHGLTMCIKCGKLVDSIVINKC